MPLLISKPVQMLEFINALRATDKYIADIYLNGGCYQFHLLLQKFCTHCQPFINKEKTHIVTRFFGRYYDITGEVSGNWYTPLSESEKKIAENWSFHQFKSIQISECPFCEEPLIV